jgi:hypothetical protein
MKSMMRLALGLLVLAACDDKPAANNTAASASAAVSVAPTPTPTPTPSVAPSATASAAPASSATMISGADSDDVALTVRDPSKEPEKTVKAKAGGAFTAFLPDTGGMVWAADSLGTLGKPKEEVIPGFAPQTMGHQFKWTGLKAGKTKVVFGNRKAADKGAGKPAATFTLNLEVN